MHIDRYVSGFGSRRGSPSLPDDAFEWSTYQLSQRRQLGDIANPRKGQMQLPLADLGAEVFEALVAELIALREDSSVHFYGRSGQKQHGLDIYEEERDGSRTLYQVKRFQSMTPAALRAAVEEWAGEPQVRHPNRATGRRFDAERFVVVTSAPVDDNTATTDELADLQRRYHRDIRIDLWGAEAVSGRLRGKPSIVVGFLGEAWANEFCGRDLTREAVKERRRLREAESCLAQAVSTQFGIDDKVKFRQADLVGITVDKLFVDVPVRTDAATPIGEFLPNHSDVEGANGADGTDETERVVAGAMQLLLHPNWTKSVVLVGGPGQGKSTLLQYLCQYHRSRQYAPERYQPTTIGLSLVSDTIRTPLRVDLPAYAEWRRERLRRLNEAKERETSTRRGKLPAHPTIEAYLIEVVEKLGSLRFGLRGFHHVAQTQPLLLGLDGLDEVADANEREQIADEIRATEARLRALQSGTLVVVATRPGATGNPIWRDQAFATLFLQRLTPALRMVYLNKWLETVVLDDDEVADLRQAFEEAMAQPHVSELAGNPMQLAILLHLMHKIPSLPEKRTELYEKYVDIFMQRESKDSVIRKNRSLIIDFHRVLAWHIHANVELQHSTGTVSYDELQAVLSAYLAPRGISPEVIERIFGSVQRVLCLSEPATGTREFRFDVQPLREYFASAYLYETAPDASDVNLPQAILEALLPRQYWSNVLRFFAGELRAGEIPNIGYALEAVAEDPICGPHPIHRVLARQLMEDQVFANQHAVVVRDIVTKMLSGSGVQLALDGLLQQDDQVLGFASETASKAAVVYLTDQIKAGADDVAIPAARLMSELGHANRLAPGDLDASSLPPLSHIRRLLSLGVLRKPTRETAALVDALVAELSFDAPLLDDLLRAEVHIEGPALLAHCHAELADGRVSTMLGPRAIDTAIGRLVNAASGDPYYARANHPHLEHHLSVAPPKYVGEPDLDASTRRRRRTRRGALVPTLVSALERVEEPLRTAADWTTSDAWSRLFESVSQGWGAGAWPLREALLAAPPKLHAQLASRTASLTAEASWPDVIEWRRRALEHRENIGWWQEQVASCTDPIARSTFVVYALVTPKAAVVQAVVPALDDMLGQLGSLSAGTLATTLNRFALNNPARSLLRLTEPLRLQQIKPSAQLAALIWQLGDDGTRTQLVKPINKQPSKLWDGSLTTMGTALRCLTHGDGKIPWRAFRGARQLVPAGLIPVERLSKLSLVEAQSILSSTQHWPTDIVRVAVDRVGQELGELTPIAQVALEQGWTGSDGDLVGIRVPRSASPAARPLAPTPSP